MVYNEREMEDLISTTESEIAELILKKMQSSNINFGMKNATYQVKETLGLPFLMEEELEIELLDEDFDELTDAEAEALFREQFSGQE